MFDWIYTSPLTVAALTMAALFVGFTWLGSIFLAPIFRLFVRSRTGTNDIVGNILSSFGVLYGILLGLTAVAAYQNWSDVDAKITEEAGAILSLHSDISTYPEPYRTDMRDLLRDVVEATITEEWDKLRDEQITVGTGETVSHLRSRLVSFEPQTKAQEYVHQEAIAHLNDFIEKRRFRIYSVTAGIPAVLWYVVIIGAIFNIVLIWLLDMKFVSQLFLGGLLAFFLGAMILMIARLDKPFQSADGVNPDALRLVYRIMTSN